MKHFKLALFFSAMAFIAGYAAPHAMAVVSGDECICSLKADKNPETCRGGTCDGGSVSAPINCDTCCEGLVCSYEDATSFPADPPFNSALAPTNP